MGPRAAGPSRQAAECGPVAPRRRREACDKRAVEMLWERWNISELRKAFPLDGPGTMLASMRLRNQAVCIMACRAARACTAPHMHDITLFDLETPRDLRPSHEHNRLKCAQCAGATWSISAHACLRTKLLW